MSKGLTPEALREWADQYEDATRLSMRKYADAWEKSLTLPDGAVYLGKPTAFWYELLNLSRERGYEESVDQIVLLKARLEAAERESKRQFDAILKELGSIVALPDDLPFLHNARIIATAGYEGRPIPAGLAREEKRDG